MERKFIWLALGILVILAFVTIALVLTQGSSYRGVLYEPPLPAFDFSLVGADGNTIALHDFRGQVILLYFGYTSCPDVCPTTMAEMKQAIDRLSPDNAEHVQVVFVSVDPKRDTPEKIQEYADHFNPLFIGLSGSQDELSKIWNDYGIYRLEVPGESALGYTVDHTARVTVIDQDGRMRVSFGFQTPVEDIVHDLQLILKRD